MRKRYLPPVLLVASMLLGMLATHGHASAHGRPATSHRPVIQRVWETFYAALDNDPPGSRNIAYPGGPPRHARATADLGTYAHPITLAADQRWLPVGTIVYAPRWRKYYVMEDQCVECEADWAKSRFHHVDLYISSSVKPAVLKAEDEGTKDQGENDIIILNPPSNLLVDTTPLYTDAGGSVVSKHEYSNTLIILYRVARGDTLNKLARRFHTTVAHLMALNHLTNPNHIYVGQQLRVNVGGDYQGIRAALGDGHHREHDDDHHR